MPLTLIDVFIRIDHSSIALGVPAYPEPIVPVSIRAEQGTPPVSFIFNPIACVLSLELAADVLPVGALAMAFVVFPHAFVLISVFVDLDSEFLLLVVFPVSDVTG